MIFIIFFRVLFLNFTGKYITKTGVKKGDFLWIRYRRRGFGKDRLQRKDI